MATNQNKEIEKNIVNELKLQRLGVDVPSVINNSIQPVFNAHDPERCVYADLSGDGVVYSTPEGKDFYLTEIIISGACNAGAGITPDFTLTFTNEYGVNQRFQVYLATEVGVPDSKVGRVTFKNGIKLQQGSDLVASSAAGVYNTHICGFIKE